MIHYPSAYVTLDEVIQQYILTDEAAFTTTTDADAAINAAHTNVVNQLKDFIFEVSADLHDTWWRDFVPVVDTLTVKARADAATWQRAWQRNTYGDLVFNLSHIPYRDLLAISSITLNDILLDSSAYDLDSADGYPAQKITFYAESVSYPSITTTTSILITGTWGYHENPAIMWRDSGDTVQDDPLTSAATTITVADASVFETYQYIKIEDEICFITALDTSTEMLTVERGANGSTAAGHVQGTAIDRYRQTPSIAKEITRMVIRTFAMKNGVNVVTAGDTIQDITTADFKLAVPKRWTIGSV